jgi:hypothetical protein
MQSATDRKFQAKNRNKTAATAYYNGTDTTRSSAKQQKLEAACSAPVISDPTEFSMCIPFLY